jgi:hypothetical protein
MLQYLVACRVFTGWGEPALVTALRNLLTVALADERNSKFILVSESCMPLRHPALFWVQNMAEAHLSRVSSEPSNLNIPGAFLATGAQQWFV